MAVPGGQIVYTVKVTQQRPQRGERRRGADDLTNSDIARVSWTCLPSPEASCGAATNGSGDISRAGDQLAQTHYVEYTVTVTLSAGATGAV